MHSSINVMVAAGGKGCSPLLFTNNVSYRDPEPQAMEYTFSFKTTDKEKPQYTTFTITAEGCVSKSVPLHNGNLSFVNKEP